MDCIKNTSCALCKLGTSTSVCFMNEPTEQFDIMVVAEKPKLNDIESNTVLNNRLFELVCDRAVGIPLYSIYRTYVAKCYTEDTVVYKDANICYENYLKKEIEIVKPKVIITLGELAMNCVTGLSGITKQRGKKIDIQVDGFNTSVIPTYAAGYVENNESKIQEFAGDIQLAYQISIGYEPEDKKTKYILVDTVKKFEELLEYIEQVGHSAFDFETTGLDYYNDSFYVTGLSFTFQQGSGYFVPFYHKEPIFDETGKKIIEFKEPIFTNTEVNYFISLLKVKFFENPTIRKVAHNLKYDLHCCRTLGITVFRGRYDDTMLMHHVLNGKLTHGLKDCIDTYYKDLSGYEDKIKKYEWNAMPLELLGEYSATDTDGTFRLATQFELELLEDERSYVLYRNHAIPVCFALEEAEWNGMYIDKEFTELAIKEVEDLVNVQQEKLKSYKQVKRFEVIKLEDAVKDELTKLHDKLQEYEIKYKPESKTIQNVKDKITKIKSGQVKVYDGVNFSSPKQLEELLYAEYGFGFKKKFDKRSKQEVGGTGKLILNEIKDNSGFINDLLVLRSMEKILGTYIKGIYERCDKTSYVHTDLKQIGTYTGRLSSGNPNLQNLPSVGKLKDETARYVVGKVKQMFAVPTNHTLLAVDFSQAELRTVAYFADEKNMMKAYADKLDLHILTGAKLGGYTLDQFNELPKDTQKELRTNAKAANFGLLYDMSAEGFMEYAKNTYGLIVDLSTAEQMKEAFFDLYPNLRVYHATYKAKGKKYGYVRTLFGRRVFLPDIYSKDRFLQGQAERQAINAPIQGTAGEWTLFAIALLRHRLDPRVKFVNTVHDSILFYCPDELVDSSMAIIKDTCENPPTMKYFNRQMEGIEMKIDAEIGKKSWKELEPYK